MFPVTDQPFRTPIGGLVARHLRQFLRDYESVKVVRAATADIDQISQITRLSKCVISQYLDLIPEDQLQTMDAALANSTANEDASQQGKGSQ